MLDQLMSEILAGTTQDVPTSVLIFRIACAGVIALVAHYIFSFFGHFKNTNTKLLKVCLIVAVMVAFLISVVGDNLARSFGLLGALSIIRFRTPVKDITELTQILISIGVGIGAGAGFVSVTVLTLAVILSFLFIFEYAQKSVSESEYVLRLTYKTDEEPLEKLKKVFLQQSVNFEFLNMATSGSIVESNLKIKLKLNSEEEVVRKVKQAHDFTQVDLICLTKDIEI